MQLPVFPPERWNSTRTWRAGATPAKSSRFTGNCGCAPARSDLASFRMVTRQLIVQGSVTTGPVQRTFGVPLVSIKRGTKLYRARWAAGFFASQPRRPAKRRR